MIVVLAILFDPRLNIPTTTVTLPLESTNQVAVSNLLKGFATLLVEIDRFVDALWQDLASLILHF